MHTQKETVNSIIDSGNHYVIQVKGNQPNLFSEIQRVIVEQEPIDTFTEEEKNHGRHSIWTVMVFNAIQNEKTSEWKNIRRLIHVHKQTFSKKGESHSNRLYISDLFTTDAAFFHEGIRRHWTIENMLHWVKDVIHREDKNQIRKKNGPVNAAVFSSIAINITRKNGFQSITEGILNFSANVNELFKLIK